MSLLDLSLQFARQTVPVTLRRWARRRSGTRVSARKWRVGWPFSHNAGTVNWPLDPKFREIRRRTARYELCTRACGFWFSCGRAKVALGGAQNGSRSENCNSEDQMMSDGCILIQKRAPKMDIPLSHSNARIGPVITGSVRNRTPTTARKHQHTIRRNLWL